MRPGLFYSIRVWLENRSRCDSRGRELEFVADIADAGRQANHAFSQAGFIAGLDIAAQDDNLAIRNHFNAPRIGKHRGSVEYPAYVGLHLGGCKLRSWEVQRCGVSNLSGQCDHDTALVRTVGPTETRVATHACGASPISGRACGISGTCGCCACAAGRTRACRGKCVARSAGCVQRLAKAPRCRGIRGSGATLPVNRCVVAAQDVG